MLYREHRSISYFAVRQSCRHVDSLALIISLFSPFFNVITIYFVLFFKILCVIFVLFFKIFS